MNCFQHPPRRLLLIKPSSMGDVIHALPVAAALHDAWPATEIRWLLHPAFKELIEGNPAIARPLFFPRDQFRGIMGGIRSLHWASTLRDWQPDMAIDLQGLLRSALIGRCSGARSILGLSDAREGASFFYSHVTTVDPTSHAVTRYLRVLETLGIPQREPTFSLPAGKVPAEFSVQSPFVVMHPYARGEGKNLTQEQVLAFAETVNSLPIVLVGQGEKMDRLPAHVLDWSGRTSLLELIGILRCASFIVSSDSGPMHLAAALQPNRVIAIHRWSDPLRVGPWPPTAFVWKNGQLQSHDQLTEASRPPGRDPTLDDLKEVGRFVLSKVVSL